MQISLRAVAAADVESAVNHYRETASPTVASGFVDEFEKAISMLTQHPHSGSLRFAYELDIPELRSWSLDKFPYIVFYLAEANHLDIWRVLHAQRDIPASLHTDDSQPE